MREIRWGILGPGRIAQNFAHHLARVEGARLSVVASRELPRAEALAQPYGARAVEGYDALAQAQDVDAVYVATPHSHHLEHVLLCLKAGKAVLCEKPMGANAAQVQQMMDAARESDVYLMEAMWSRFLPAARQMMKWIDEGAIGKPLYLNANFSFRSQFDAQSRLYAKELAGGGLLDVGVYPISMAMMALGGMPDRIAGFANFAPTGVDAQAAIALGFAGGALANLQCGVEVTTQDTLTVFGETGRIHLPRFWCCERAELYAEGKEPEVFHSPLDGKDFSYEIAAVCEDLRAGRTQNTIMPLADTLDVLRVTDALRQSWGFKYPFE